MQSHLGPPSNIPSQPYPRRAHESKRPAACPTVHGPNLSVNLHLICISVSPKYIDIFLTLPPPALSLSLSLSLSPPLIHTHTHTHTLTQPGSSSLRCLEDWGAPSGPLHLPRTPLLVSQCSCPPATTRCMESGSKPRAGAPCWAEQTLFFPRSWGGGTLQHGCRNGQTG